MNAVEAANYVDLSERNFRQQAAEGLFPAIRIGRRVVFRRDALDDALARLESKTK
jgi:excisionase family DNA binding protein